ncbi:hypothetical protein LEP1GSC047_2771 [Leptospira inadai serovar Lyme str. 10]|uniref:Uncharacterized protein n=2 Tax=Leptospira inadai serovar Lyme TaxID=293084 RepID=V6HIB6_9LEPT|nr:hypothetical protein [Leptospira inadai]EQA36370.1 hypothetical protein LEP1GSC047_2771 [Leptospira inadai serovar Lyme str. 10]PNV76445.1 hypothetical protein BES34_002270 [Leptospira inadai serovar Lyme]
MIHREIDENRTREEKISSLNQFLTGHPNLEIQDFYKWLYFGEFGEIAIQEFFTEKKNAPTLHSMLEGLKADSQLKTIPERVWEPLGFSQRYLMVYLTPYSRLEYPLMRIVNLMQRSSAFQGYRMRFKLDWIMLKDEIVSRDIGFSKQDFINFEDKIQFHQLPELDFTDSFKAYYPASYRIIATKLFFEYFPEFVQEPRGFHLLEDVPMVQLVESNEDEEMIYPRWEGEAL